LLVELDPISFQRDPTREKNLQLSLLAVL